METKSKAKKLDLIDQPIPIFLTGERQMFKGAFPPTKKDAQIQIQIQKLLLTKNYT